MKYMGRVVHGPSCIPGSCAWCCVKTRKIDKKEITDMRMVLRKNPEDRQKRDYGHATTSPKE